MDKDQFNELLANVMLVALNTAGVFQQNQRKRPLAVEEIDQLQIDVLKHTQKLKSYLDNKNPAHEWAPILSGLASGRSDSDV